LHALGRSYAGGRVSACGRAHVTCVRVLMHQGEQPSRTDAFFEALALNGCLAHHDGWMLWTGALRTTTGGWLTLPEEAACEDQTWTLLVAPCHKSMDTFGGPLSQKLGHFWWPLVTKAWTLLVAPCHKSMDSFGGPLSQKHGHFWWPLVTKAWTLLVAPCHKSMDTFGGPLSQKLGHFWWPLVTKAWTLFVDECQADGCLGQHHDLCSCTTRGSVGHLTRLCCGSSTTQDRLGVTLLCGFFWAANYHHLQQ